MTYQTSFGGAWTQQKLEALGKVPPRIHKDLQENPKARFSFISYVDAFAGTGSLQRPELGPFADLIPEMRANELEYRKGSVRRALEVEPSFDQYVFIEKSAKKCAELQGLAASFPDKDVRIVNEDANTALLNWCSNLNVRRERAVVFLDPFGASVDWQVVVALGRTRAVDLWVLFPYFAINRMLVRDRKPPKAWATRLTAVFGTTEWETAFYSATTSASLLEPHERVETVYKSADYYGITEFFVRRLQKEFVEVSELLPLRNSTGSLLFMLFFAAGNQKSAEVGMKIANAIIGK